MSFINLPPDNSRYTNTRDDLRVNVSSGVLTLRDGTSGGIPVADTTFGLPVNLFSQPERPSGIEGWSLQRFQNEFPRYTKIQKDPSSVGGQILTPVSMIYDEVFDETTRTLDKLNITFYPLYEQGVIYEYDFASSNNLTSKTGVSGRLGDQWFNLPITTDSEQFWLAPPTRFETTTAEISGLDVLGWTVITHSGVNTLISGKTSPPLYNRLTIQISGATEFQYAISDDVPARFARIELKGQFSDDSLRPTSVLRQESILVDRNGPFITRNSYRALDQVEVVGLPSGTNIKISTFNFQADWRPDDLVKYQNEIRDDISQFIVWHNIHENISFNQITQTEVANALSTSGHSYLARTYIQFDTFAERDIEFDTIDIWALYDSSGNKLSGILDVVQVPNTRYLLALDRLSRIHVFDTFIPAYNMAGRAPVRNSPIYLEPSWPSDSDQLTGAYTLRVYPQYAASQSAVQLQRWQWSLDKAGTSYVVIGSGTLQPFHQLSGWVSHTSGTISPIEITVDQPGQYTIQLETVDAYGERYRAWTAHRKIAKRAITTCPINGLTANPSGIDIDSYNRPWVKLSSDTAIRLVMRTDIGFWSLDERVLLTREPYDEVRQNA